MTEEIDYSIWTREDLSGYFSSTYVGVKNNKGVIDPCYVTGTLNVEGVNGSTVGFIGSTGVRGRMGEGEKIACAFQSPKVKIFIPESSFVNCKNECVYMSRRTERKYKKGISKSSFKQVNISTGDFVDDDGYNIMDFPYFDDEIIKGMFNPNYVTFEEAKRVLQAGEKLSVAFDKHFALANKRHVPDVVMYYKGLACGTVRADGGVQLEDEFMALEDKLIEILEREHG